MENIKLEENLGPMLDIHPIKGMSQQREERRREKLAKPREEGSRLPLDCGHLTGCNGF